MIKQSFAIDQLLSNIQNYNYEGNVVDKVKQDIQNIIKGVYERKGINIAVELKDILVKYATRIGKEKFDFGRLTNVKYTVPLKPGTHPISSKPYNHPKYIEDEIDNICDTLLKAGVISEYNGAWGAPTILVINNDGSTRMCVDYKRINDKTLPMSFPCPSVNDVITDFHGMKIFSKFDIIKAFYNIPVAEEDKEKTAFVTKRGAYVWNVMPFGGKNCPATWALASEQAFKHMRGLIKYIDDFTDRSTNN